MATLDSKGASNSNARRSVSGLTAYLGFSGIAALAGTLLFVAVISMAFAAIRPPTVDDIEHDIWRDWARFTTDPLGRTLVELLLDDRKEAMTGVLQSLGSLIQADGDRFLVRTEIQKIRVYDRKGALFAEWNSSNEPVEIGWKTLDIELNDREEGNVGSLEVTYKFYGGGLESLPNIRRLQQVYQAAVWLVGFLAVLLLIAVVANLLRLRERAARLQSQQVTIDLAHQMCHELRNGLWAFSMEGKSIRQCFEKVEEFVSAIPNALDNAAEQAPLDARTRSRLTRAFDKALIDQQVDPKTDILPFVEMAKVGEKQIENFSRYVNLTVEELDRYLLGIDGQFSPIRLSVREAWQEAKELLHLRISSARVHVTEQLTEQDIVLVDRRLLMHVLVNLLKNAIEAMREDKGPKQIAFHERIDNGHVILSMTNTGPPIASENLARLFEPGFTTKSGGGRGTGLKLVRQSIARMGGSIDVSSAAGTGTTFSISLPRPKNGEEPQNDLGSQPT